MPKQTFDISDEASVLANECAPSSESKAAWRGL